MKFLPSKSDRRVFDKICSEYDLVYFGTADRRDDGYKQIQGLTQSPHQRDENYCVGDVHGYPVVFIERHITVKKRGEKARGYRWVILQIELSSTYLPHIFVSGRRRDHELYGSLVASFLRLMVVSHRHFPSVDNDEFADTFTVYAQPDAVATIEQIFTPAITKVLAAHYGELDFEMNEDKLLIYSSDHHVTLRLLSTMLRAGIWLARHLDAQIVTTPEQIKSGIISKN